MHECDITSSRSQKPPQVYTGFEQGPIRPPSEARSLLIRVTRNCPWNRCTFCPVYKGERFSLRPKDHVIKDIDMVHRQVEQLGKLAGKDGYIDQAAVNRKAGNIGPDEVQAFHAALNWMAGGMESIFLQDANSLIIKPEDLVLILGHLRNRFPWVKRVTSYARSHTIARIREEDMVAIAAAGLNRIHIGLESGADEVLKKVQKGVTQAMQIQAGKKVKSAGIELSEYVMPGLGGVAMSDIHARETASALNQINPDFIRLRSLAIPNTVDLYKEWESGGFEKCTDRMTAKEILLFIKSLTGITSTIKSDHILNLFEEVNGRLPEDKEKMTAVLESFLAMEPRRQMVYQVGRRLGLFSGLRDMADRGRLAQAEQACRRFGITPATVDAAIDELMKRFI